MRLVQNWSNETLAKFKKKLGNKLESVTKNIKFRTRVSNEIVNA